MAIGCSLVLSNKSVEQVRNDVYVRSHVDFDITSTTADFSRFLESLGFIESFADTVSKESRFTLVMSGIEHDVVVKVTSEGVYVVMDSKWSSLNPMAKRPTSEFGKLVRTLRDWWRVRAEAQLP